MRAAILIALLAGCTAITEFDTDLVVEDNSALCSDGVDNDDNSLADCQDWTCLNTEVCCTIPTVVLQDSFDGPACAADSCDDPDLTCGPDPALWTTWGSPDPLLCEGSLSPHKLEQCYDVGVYSNEAFALRPGLATVVGVVGAPEIKGRLTLGFTFQNEILGSVDPCATIDTATPAVTVQLLSDEDGARYVARFDQVEVGVSPLVTDEGRHEIRIAVVDDRLVRFQLDGETFATSPAQQPIPETVEPARLVLAGRGLSARIDDVRVTAGTQCDAPGSWEPLTNFALLEPSGDDTQWDGFALYSPALIHGRTGGYSLYYSGCRGRLGGCDPILAGIGTASSANDLVFTRDDSCPIIGTTAAVCEDGLATGTPFDDRFNNIIDTTLIAIDGSNVAYVSQLLDGPEIAPVDADDLTEMAEGAGLRTGAAGEWDAHEVCCATAVVHEGTVEMWYAGRSGPEEPWRIGRATSVDGVEFTKDETNPVLRQGVAGDSDDRGVGEPSVVYDPDRSLYRMWYTATGFFGTTSIGYAVSADGLVWLKSPGNPVLAPEQVGLQSIGAPDVSIDEGRQLMLLTGGAGDGRGTSIYGVVNRGEAFVEPDG